MASETNLIFDTDKLSFIRSIAEPSIVDSPVWYADDVRLLKVRFVKRGSSSAQVEVIPGAGITVTIAVGDPLTNPTVFSSVTAGAADGDNVFTASLPLNVAPIQTALGTSLIRSCSIEFKLTDGSAVHHYSTTVFIKQRLITGTLQDTAPPDVAMSVGQGMSLFVPRNGNDSTYPCSGFLIQDESDPTKIYKFSVRDGQPHYEPLQ